MRTYAIWFEDRTNAPDYVRGITPARGLPSMWLTALLGIAKAREVRYLGDSEEVISGVLVDVSDEIAEQFCAVLRGASETLGTIAWTRDYQKASYQLAWDSNTLLETTHH